MIYYYIQDILYDVSDVFHKWYRVGGYDVMKTDVIEGKDGEDKPNPAPKRTNFEMKY